MRIDYSEPRRAQRSPNYQNQRTSEPRSGRGKGLALLILAVMLFGAGFGSGWILSEKATKKAFRAATEINQADQQKLQAQQQAVQQPAPQPGAPVAGQTQQPAPAGSVAAPAGHPTNQVPLSFFETLPKGQKQTVLGSGINDKPKAPIAAPTAAKQPSGFVVQAAAYLSSKDAETLKTKLIAKGHQATVAQTTINNRIWYRVRIGSHLDKEAATQLATKVGGGAKVVPDE